MQHTALHNRLVSREGPAQLLSVLAYNPDDHSFYCEDGTLGCVFKCYPLLGANESKVGQLQVLFQQDFPPGTIMQVALWAGPDIENTTYIMNAMRQPKEDDHIGEGRRIATAIIRRRAEFLKRHTEQPISERTGLQVRDVHVYISIKMPCRSLMPTDRDVDVFRRTYRTSKSILETIGMAPQDLDPEKYIRSLGSILNWGKNASWRNPALIYDHNLCVRDQVFDTETSVRVEKRGIQLGEKYVKTLSVKRLPEYVHLAQAAQFLGDARTGQ
ncbi:MAG: conjugal transfer protein TraC, partial [Pseudomonadales bacterium]